ncbi:hypothetical protein STRDD11_01302 [Streptococcus sp. DD11]|nr:hypothetical protein STRDD11_01302 [Streptococcus sp. DD11]
MADERVCSDDFMADAGCSSLTDLMKVESGTKIGQTESSILPPQSLATL